jgi:hypothetical protein
MKRLTFLTFVFVLFAFIGCQQSAESRYQRYLEEVADTSGIEFITPEEDPVEYVEDNLGDPFADDGGVITVPDIPQQHEVSRYGSNYEVEKVMMGKE